ncbi:MAG: beta-ketoacyl-[acyl-carrier-protein] synthase family protein [Verrucomicrobiae bacterium]|nr:beta-ketoacyl-[acyl-carrier-protein] synthase family protein [Verrucomicrobiae bacterium]
MNSVMVNLLRERPIVVTGMGSFSSAGDSVSALWNAAIAGRSLAVWRDFGNGDDGSRFAVCSAPEIDVSRPELRAVRRLDRSVQMAWVAANQAWEQARLADVYAPERIGVMVGSSRGPLGKRIETLREGTKLLPSLAADTTFASLSGALAQSFKLRGPGASISATCASSAFAIGLAAEQILLDRVDAMLVGGAEAPLQAALLKQLHATGVMGFHPEAEQTCRPFDINRNGMLVGEGSGFLVLESAQAARARSAHVHARIAGWAFSLDSVGRTGVTQEGSALLQTMQQALQLAELCPHEIDYVNAHGTGTRMNDAAEAQAVKTLFGPHVKNMPCSSTKPITGHCLGATPALEAVLSIEALRHQMIPPTANCTSQDPLCPINVQPVTAQSAKLSTVMSNSLGFWGYHASLIFSQ